MSSRWKLIMIIIGTSQTLHTSTAVEELILTPLIRQGNLVKAKEMATDNINLSGIKSSLGNSATSYSGYLIINETYNSNLFFWLFPAIENPDTAPIILFINTVPGSSLLDGIFLEHGPFFLDEDLILQERNYSWAKRHTLIYIDSPVGSGFSFTNKEDGYGTSAKDESDEVCEAMKQLFTLFPEYQSRDFFIAGTGFAGRVIPKIALTLQETNGRDNIKFKIKGIILSTPFIVPRIQIAYGEVLLQLGLIDETQAELLFKEEEVFRKLVDEKKYLETAFQMLKITLTPGSLTQTLIGFTDQRNFLHANPPPEVTRYSRFVNSKEVHNYLHVGLHKFELFNQQAFSKFMDDAAHSDVLDFEKILDQGVNVLVVGPQFNSLGLRVGVEKVINSLKWKGNEDFKKARRKIWKVDDEVAGYVKSSNNLHYVMLRNSGMLAVMDQPKWCFDMVERFTSGVMF